VWRKREVVWWISFMKRSENCILCSNCFKFLCYHVSLSKQQNALLILHSTSLYEIVFGLYSMSVCKRTQKVLDWFCEIWHAGTRPCIHVVDTWWELIGRMISSGDGMYIWNLEIVSILVKLQFMTGNKVVNDIPDPSKRSHRERSNFCIQNSPNGDMIRYERWV